MLFRCQPGFEDLLLGELALLGLAPRAQGGGWVETDRAVPAGTEPGAPVAAVASEDATGLSREALEGLTFATLVLLDPLEITGDSVNQLAGRIADHFFATARTERFEGPWPCSVDEAAGLEGLGRRASAVRSALDESLKKRMSRVARLAVPDAPVRVGAVRGLFVFFTDFRRAVVARAAWCGGQRRMADDPQAPSRSYLKVEEAYGVLGAEPAAGELVVDLGAAPGGWSYSAAQRGARVLAIDNGPLKGGALDHPLIEHRLEDAFRFRLPEGERADWLFCDLVEEPHHVLRDLIEPWLAGGACRQFVVNLKFGHVRPLELLAELRGGASPFSRYATEVRVRHLFHDREEFTVVGRVG